MWREMKYRVGTAIGRPRRWRYLEHAPKGAVCAEIGVYRGQFTREILRVTQPSELHLIDGWWTLFGERYPRGVGEYREGETLTTRQAYEETLEAADERCQVHVGDDLEVLEQFPDRYFDWVYLDSSHEYEATVKELALLDRKVKHLILGDDWKPDPQHIFHGVYRAVNEFCEAGAWELLPPDPVWDQFAIRRR
jgi:hypothetical protein